MKFKFSAFNVRGLDHNDNKSGTLFTPLISENFTYYNSYIKITNHTFAR